MTASVEDRLDEHDKKFRLTDERLNSQGERIKQLEKWDEDKHKRLKVVEDHYTELKSTIITENREMRSFFQSNMDKQWDLIKDRDERNHDKYKMEHEFRKTKWGNGVEIFLKLTGAGGIIYLVVKSALGI